MAAACHPFGTIPNKRPISVATQERAYSSIALNLTIKLCRSGTLRPMILNRMCAALDGSSDQMTDDVSRREVNG